MISLTDLAAAATMVGVPVAAYHLRAAARGARTSFEDALAREYRDIARSIPMSAHLNVAPGPGDVDALLPEMFKYFDLCNQQVFFTVKRACWAQHLARVAGRH